MTKRIILSLFCLICLFFSCKTSHLNLYISVDGDDTGNGSLAKPFRTLERAKKEIGDYRKSNGAVPVNVNLRSGDYFMDATFVLDSLTNGLDDPEIVFQSYENEKVRLIGGKILNKNSFSKVTDTQIINKMINREVRNKLYETNLRVQGITDLGEIKQFGFSTAIKPSQSELYYAHQPMVLARYPNQGKIPIGKVLKTGSIPFNGDFSNVGGTFLYQCSRVKKWEKSKNIWLYGIFSEGYTDNNVKVLKVDSSLNAISTIQPDIFGYMQTDSLSEWGGKVRGYYAYNILEEIDVPDEYYIDNETGILYLFPEDSLFVNEIALSTADYPLITLDAASNICFKGIDFEYGRDMAICMVKGKNNSLVDCTISNFGTLGIMFGQGIVSPEGPIHEFTGKLETGIIGNIKAHVYLNNDFYNFAGSDNEIRNCRIYNTGSGGVVLSGGNRKTLESGNNRLINCEIFNYNLRNKTYCPGVAIFGVANQVSNCYIHEGSQQAISINGNNHLITQNIISRMTLDSHDNGAIYIGRNPTERGNIISYNLFYDIGMPGRKNCSIHLDDCASGIKVFGNIFYKGSRDDFADVVLNGGNEIEISNNVFIKGAHAAWIENPYIQVKKEYDNRMQSDGLWYKRLYQEVDLKSPVWRKEYPGLDIYYQPVQNLKFLKQNNFVRNVLIDTPLMISKHKFDFSTFKLFSDNYSMTTVPVSINSPIDILDNWINDLGEKNVKDFVPIPVSQIGLITKGKN